MTNRYGADAFAHGGREICRRYLHCAGHGDTKCGDDRQLSVQLARHARVLQTLHHQRLAAAGATAAAVAPAPTFTVSLPALAAACLATLDRTAYFSRGPPIHT